MASRVKITLKITLKRATDNRLSNLIPNQVPMAPLKIIASVNGNHCQKLKQAPHKQQLLNYAARS